MLPGAAWSFKERMDVMAPNFKIFSCKTRDSLHLQLTGDFDGSSAHELINTLMEHGSRCYQIFINTNGLKAVHPFGRDVFQKKLDTIGKRFDNLIFIGENKHNIS